MLYLLPCDILSVAKGDVTVTVRLRRVDQTTDDNPL